MDIMENSPFVPQRLTSIDAYRGFVMFLMMAEVLRTCEVAHTLRDSSFWKLLCHQQTHVEWTGSSLHDLIQPGFSFLVGIALPYSIASRRARGQTFSWMTLHAAWRSLVLILLGVFLRSIGHSQTNWTFEDTLSQIGMGYLFLFLLGWTSIRTQLIACGLILFGYWLAFALYPVPGPNFDWSTTGVPADWTHNAAGFAAHWNKNTNAAWAFDQWFLNLFPREKPFLFNGGGYSTLSFIPTLATMILGLWAGNVLRSDQTSIRKLNSLCLIGLALLALGWFAGWMGICPVVKKVWTPSWVLFSGGWCFLFLAAFYGAIDITGYRRWAYPLVVIGANSISSYCMAHLFEGFIEENLKTNLGLHFFEFAGKTYEPFLVGAATLLALWLILLWMYRRKIFLRI